MSKIVLTAGISGSGKSTWAHEQWKENPLNTIIVSRDNIRYMFGYTEETIKDYYSRPDLNKLEKQVTKYEDTLIYEALCENKTVIVDATHLDKKYITRFEYWNVPIELKCFNITLKEALTRDVGRKRQVGEKVISKQYTKYLSLINGLPDYSFTPKVLDNSIERPMCYVFDIDGTLAEKGDRSPYDWGKIGLDTSIKSVEGILKNLSLHNRKIYICSGRDNICLEETKEWFKDVLKVSPYKFEFMFREHNDMRADWIVKQEMAEEICKKNYISCWFDDRLQVTRHLRQLGLKVLNVEHNNF